MTTPKTEWRDEHGRYLIVDRRGRYTFDFQAEDEARKGLTEGDARFLLRVLPEASGFPETLRVREAIADRFGAGDSVAELAADYDITPEAVEACIRAERQADAAIVEAAELYATMFESDTYTVGDCEEQARKLCDAVRARREAGK